MACMGYTSEFSFSGQDFLPRARLALDLADRNLQSFVGFGVHDPHDPKNRLSTGAVHRNQLTAAGFGGYPGKQRTASAQVGRQGRFVKNLSVRVPA
jgi:hypothetical protein